MSEYSEKRKLSKELIKYYITRECKRQYYKDVIILFVIPFILLALPTLMIEYLPISINDVATIISYILVGIIAIISFFATIDTLNLFSLTLSNGFSTSIRSLFSLLKNKKKFISISKLILVKCVKIFLWSLLFIVPGIIKAIKYSQALYVRLEHDDYTTKECLDASSLLIHTHEWEYFFFMLSYLVWMILGLATIGLAFFLHAPYLSCKRGMMYKNFVIEKNRAAKYLHQTIKV